VNRDGEISGATGDGQLQLAQLAGNPGCKRLRQLLVTGPADGVGRRGGIDYRLLLIESADGEGGLRAPGESQENKGQQKSGSRSHLNLHEPPKRRGRGVG
jgi:hypothetical protein